MTLLKTRTERDCFTIVTARKRSLGQGNIFRSVCQEFCPHGGGHAWLQGACVVVWGGGGGSACVVARGHVWLPGGMHGCRGLYGCGGVHGCWGACMVAGGGMHGCQGACVVGGACLVVGGMCGCWGVHRIRQDTVNERAVRILLECMLVLNCAEFVYFNPSYCF